jgi:hypothetical protein
MIYLWEVPENFSNRDFGEYNRDCSPDSFLFRQGIGLNTAEAGRCYAYARSSLVDLADDPFIRLHLRPAMRYAYIFTAEEMLYCAGGIVSKINISHEDLKKLKRALSFTDDDIDKEPKVLSDAQLEAMRTVITYPHFSSIPTVNFEASKNRVLKFDCLPNNTLIPLVNKRIKAILESLAPDDVQFFPAKLICSDGELDNYYFLNITHTIIGIDHEKSIYTKMKTVDAISRLKYLTYKIGCMGKHQLARDQEYKGNLLVSEEMKAIFDKEHITGVWLVRPEDYYHPVTASDLINEYNKDKREK